MDKTRRSSIFNVHKFVILVNKFVLHGKKKKKSLRKKTPRKTCIKCEKLAYFQQIFIRAIG